MWKERGLRMLDAVVPAACRQARAGISAKAAFGLMQRGNAPSFDDLVGSLKERFGDRQAECLRGLEVDNQFEFGRELDGQVAGFRAPQDEIDV